MAAAAQVFSTMTSSRLTDQGSYGESKASLVVAQFPIPLMCIVANNPHVASPKIQHPLCSKGGSQPLPFSGLFRITTSAGQRE